MQKILILLLLSLSSCNLNRAYMTMFERQMLWQLEHARYVRYGNNCFMVVDGYHGVNFVYMPCDSIKGQFVPTIKPRKK